MDYELLDSGNLKKLERFGSLVLVRPSSLCLWKPRQDAAVWKAADAEYSPEKGWIFRKKLPQEWTVAQEWTMEIAPDLFLNLRLQSNGQLGLFPEHAQYMENIRHHIRMLRKKKSVSSPKVLNLFAYTGMASCAALQEGAFVTHVDTAAWALGKVTENMERNGIERSKIRLIKEDALEFMKKELRRGSVYDVVIADPPMFSRPAKQKTWKLEEMLPRFAHDVLRLVHPEHGFLVLTNHQMQHPPLVMANLLRDAAKIEKRKLELELVSLQIPECEGERALPAGNLLLARAGQGGL